MLLVLVGGVHYGYQPLAEWLGWRPGAVFYILRGVEGAALFAVVVWLAARRYGWGLVTAVAGWGFIEETQTAVCRLSQDMTSAPQVAPYSGLCGTWAYAIGVVFMAVLAAAIARGARNG